MNAIIGLTHLAQRHAGDTEQYQRLSRWPMRPITCWPSSTRHSRHLQDRGRQTAARGTPTFRLHQLCLNACERVAQRAEAKAVARPLRIRPSHAGSDARRSDAHPADLLNFLSTPSNSPSAARSACAPQVLSQQNGYITIRCTITDTGIGISAEKPVPPVPAPSNRATPRPPAATAAPGLAWRSASGWRGPYVKSASKTPGIGRASAAGPSGSPARLPPAPAVSGALRPCWRGRPSWLPKTPSMLKCLRQPQGRPPGRRA